MKANNTLQGIKPSYIREILKAAKSPDVISLAGGLPSADMIPTTLFSEALEEILKSPRSVLSDQLQYGETIGYPPLINTIKRYYSIDDGTELMITNGSQQGLDLIARAFINAGDNILVEAPSYLGALQTFSLAQAKIHAVKQVNNGPDLAELETLFSSQQIKLFYAVPDFHNPTGSCWPLDTRKRVAELCLQYDVTLVEDAPYRELRFHGEDLPLVSSFCKNQSIRLRSFSKIAAPGMRLGAVLAPALLMSPLTTVKQAADLHTAIPLQVALMHLLENTQFPDHLNKTREAYLLRYKEFIQHLSRLRHYGCDFGDIQGGMFVWLTLPEIDPLLVADDLLKQGLAVVPSTVFYHDKRDVQSALRLNFTCEKIEKLHKAIVKLEKYLLKKLRAQTP